jgi:hypothetical protein
VVIDSVLENRYNTIDKSISDLSKIVSAFTPHLPFAEEAPNLVGDTKGA